MEDRVHRTDPDDGKLYSLSASDELGVLSSTRAVVDEAKYVWIHPEQVELLSEQWIRTSPSTTSSGKNDSFNSPLWDNEYHFFDGTERTVNWLLLLDALNFCFWAEKGSPRWQIDYKGQRLNGYWAEAASLTRAVQEGMPLWDAEYLSTMSEETMAAIFRPLLGASPIPLFEQRVANAREVGRVLLEKYEGQFARAVEQVKGDAVQLALLLAHHFPSFHDVACYRGHEVRFFKRAQIYVADLYGSFGGKQWGAFTNIGALTIFADYKLPQVLRHYGVLEYHPIVAERIDNEELLAPGSEEEVEIRAATVWACELLRRAMPQRGHAMNALEIDQRLWLLGQNAAAMHPYHRTRTQYY